MCVDAGVLLVLLLFWMCVFVFKLGCAVCVVTFCGCLWFRLCWGCFVGVRVCVSVLMCLCVVCFRFVLFCFVCFRRVAVVVLCFMCLCWLGVFVVARWLVALCFMWWLVVFRFVVFVLFRAGVLLCFDGLHGAMWCCVFVCDVVLLCDCFACVSVCVTFVCVALVCCVCCVLCCGAFVLSSCLRGVAFAFASVRVL